MAGGQPSRAALHARTHAKPPCLHSTRDSHDPTAHRVLVLGPPLLHLHQPLLLPAPRRRPALQRLVAVVGGQGLPRGTALAQHACGEGRGRRTRQRVRGGVASRGWGGGGGGHCFGLHDGAAGAAHTWPRHAGPACWLPQRSRPPWLIQKTILRRSTSGGTPNRSASSAAGHSGRCWKAMRMEACRGDTWGGECGGIQEGAMQR